MTVNQLTKERESSRTRQWEQALNLLYINFWDYSHDALNAFEVEDIHQARVNCRKLLTLLTLLDPQHTSELQPILAKAHKRLGKVRDADVLIEAFESKRKQAKQDGDTKTAELLKAVIKHQKDKRKRYRKKLAVVLPELINEQLDEKWKSFLSEQLNTLIANKDINVVIRELEVAYEQKKKACKAYFRGPDTNSEGAFECLHQLRIAAKKLRYTASAAKPLLHQKFHAHEELYKQIQAELGHINDIRNWLDMLKTTGRKELGIGKKTWNTFIAKLESDLLAALNQNNVIPVASQTK